MSIINEVAEQYAATHTSPVDALLNEIITFTESNHPKHHMLSGVHQGKLLEWLSKLHRPKYILEIGTFTGFSALCLAKGLLANGELHTIELRAEDAMVAQGFFNKSKQVDQIKLHIGNAIEIIPNIDLQWDLIFIDADKVSYSKYYDLILPRLNRTGFIIVDNVFFHGDVFQNEIKGKNAKAIAAFNAKVINDDSVETIMLTIRDGLTLIRKK